MPTPSLDDAFDKLRWARKHFEVLRPQIEAFEQRDAHSVSVELDAGASEYVFYVRGLEPPDPDWGLQIGDCLHNARTALDYLMVRLYALVTGEEPRDIERIHFPIYDNPGRFTGAVTEPRKHPSFSGYLARIEELQPFNEGNPSVWGLDEHGLPRHASLPVALHRLSSLDNIDKHRVIHAAWVGAAWGKGGRLELPSDFKFILSSVSAEPLRNNAEIGRYRFEPPLPHEWHPDEMDMKRCFPIEVAFDEPLPVKGVLEVLPFCLWGVDAVLALFGPVFSHGAPPLPVTAIPGSS